MKKKLFVLGLSAALAAAMTVGFAACGPEEQSVVHDDIVNGGFEDAVGSLTGWTKDGNAFGASGVVNGTTSYYGDIEVGKVGENFYDGLEGGNASFTGTLTSDVFTLGGTGKIGFLLGAAKDGEKCYVEFLEAGSDTVLARVTNTAFAEPFVTNQMVRNVVDLSEHLGKNICIRITDNDDGRDRDYAYMIFDDFVMYQTEEEVTAAETERADKLAAIGMPAFNDDTPDSITIKNGNFEEGLLNWQVLSGTAFLNPNISSSDETFWGTRSFNAEGEKFLNGYKTGENLRGELRSTTFTLGGDGIVSLLLGGSSQRQIYVAVCLAEDVGEEQAGDEIATVSPSEHFKDPELSENMVRKYIKLDDAYMGKKLYIKIVDDAAGSPFGAITVDDVRTSMTEEETLALMISDYEWAFSLGNDTIAQATQQYYINYDYPFALPVLRFSTEAANAYVTASETPVDLNGYIEGVEAAYGDADMSTAEYSVTKAVLADGTEVTTGLDAFDITGPGMITITYQVRYGDLIAEDTFFLEVVAENDLPNKGFEMGDLTGWTVVDGQGASVTNNKVFWEADANFFDMNGQTVQYYLQEGEYFLITDEGQTITLRSETFTVAGDGIISFKFGIAKNAVSYVALCDAQTDEELLKVDNTAYFNDPLTAQVMLRRFMYAHPYMGREVYLKIVDGATSDFGFLNFDDLSINLTLDGAQAIVDADKTWAADYRQDVIVSTAEMGARTKEIINAIRSYYANLALDDISAVTIVTPVGAQIETAGTVDLTAYLAEASASMQGVGADALTASIVAVSKDGAAVTGDYAAFALTSGTYTVSYRFTHAESGKFAEASFVIVVSSEYDIVNGGFETGDLRGWTYEQGTGDGQVDGANAISSEESFWAEEIPFNQGGSYHFHGWTANPTEANAYKITSSTFTLGGSGYISFKMGGANAVVKVFTADGTQIAEYRNTEYADINFPYVEYGSRNGTMTTFVADLSAYLGEELYLELHDSGAGGWGVAFFDDIVTYYETAPVVSECFDTVMIRARVQTGTDENGNPIYAQAAEKTEYQLAWKTAVNVYQS